MLTNKIFILRIQCSLYIDMEAWLREELKSGSRPEMGVDEDETPSETISWVQESDYPTDESKRKFFGESFKIDENEILNRVIKMFLENFSALVSKSLWENRYSGARNRVRIGSSCQEINSTSIEPWPESRFKRTTWWMDTTRSYWTSKQSLGIPSSPS